MPSENTARAPPTEAREDRVGIIGDSACCRAFLGQRRGKKDLRVVMKLEGRGGGLKMDWSKPLRGPFMGIECLPGSQGRAKSWWGSYCRVIWMAE